MSSKKWCASSCMFFLICMALINPGTVMSVVSAQPKVDPQASSQTEFITAQELKTQIANNQPLTIIDVRATGGLGSDERKIKGAIHVKLRRLKYRLGFPPLKYAPRDREVVTYCACPSDEASIRAAQLLLQAGFKRVRVLKGGWVDWRKVNGQMETAAKGI
jgi:rhodanese-related sulfurtransferase